MGAYIINVPDTVDTIIYVNIGDVYDGKTYIASQRVEDLAPYTDPDMEQVRKEAYDKGYDDATAEIGSDEQAIAEKAYQKGLSDAWDAARKIVTTKGIPAGDMAMVFDDEVNYDYIFSHYSASEAIEKIRQYEQEQKEIIDPDKNKVEALANDIGIHKLFALVKEIRGE